MKDFKNLTTEEYNKLLQFPAYISLLAANVDGYLDDAEKDAAAELTHIKTFSGDPLLVKFFEDVEVGFQEQMMNLNSKLPIERDQREMAIKDKLSKLENTLTLLDEKYAKALHKSMKSFKEHVSQAHHNVLVDFLFPIPIKGLSY
jgi:chorismate mutase